MLKDYSQPPGLAEKLLMNMLASPAGNGLAMTICSNIKHPLILHNHKNILIFFLHQVLLARKFFEVICIGF